VSIDRQARADAERILGHLCGRPYLLVGIASAEETPPPPLFFWERVLSSFPEATDLPVFVASLGADAPTPRRRPGSETAPSYQLEGARALATLAALAAEAELVVTEDGPLVPVALALGRPAVAVFADRSAALRRGGWGPNGWLVREVVLPSDRSGGAASGRVMAAVYKVLQAETGRVRKATPGASSE
jgi:ADP-heptose:LPS heptosyltransferase